MPFIAPRHSRSRVNRAATEVIQNGWNNPIPYVVNISIVENWRASHAHIINTFQAMLRNRAKGKNIIIAQRHKRRTTIFDKLRRFPDMQLARMQDIAGCRLIFENESELYDFRKSLNSNNRFLHEIVHPYDKYDYIKRPKMSGYRGVHDVFRYRSRTAGGQPWDGLLVEIQYRTLAQHAWATAVEIAGNITIHQPKFDRADENVLDFFRCASELIARSSESRLSVLHHLNDADLKLRFTELEQSTGLLDTLRQLRPITEHIEKRGNYVMYIDEQGKLHAEAFESQLQAIMRSFDLEAKNKESPVIARADNIDALKTAYRNYFSDANDFVALIDTALAGSG